MAKLGIVKGRRADNFLTPMPRSPVRSLRQSVRASTPNRSRTAAASPTFPVTGRKTRSRAAAFGWISGYPDGTFRPDARITRAEAMTMINRVTLPYAAESKSDLLDSMVTWPDNKPSDWHYLAVQEATNSHDFNRKGEVGESWTKLTSVPDWKRYQ